MDTLYKLLGISRPAQPVAAQSTGIAPTGYSQPVLPPHYPALLAKQALLRAQQRSSSLPVGKWFPLQPSDTYLESFPEEIFASVKLYAPAYGLSVVDDMTNQLIVFRRMPLCPRYYSL